MCHKQPEKCFRHYISSVFPTFHPNKYTKPHNGTKKQILARQTQNSNTPNTSSRTQEPTTDHPAELSLEKYIYPLCFWPFLVKFDLASNLLFPLKSRDFLVKKAGKIKSNYWILSIYFLFTALYRWCTEVSSLLTLVVILYYGGHLVLTNRLTGGHLVSFTFYSFELTTCIKDIGQVWFGPLAMLQPFC